MPGLDCSGIAKASRKEIPQHFQKTQFRSFLHHPFFLKSLLTPSGHLPSALPCIEFVDVSFAYYGSDDVLRKINCVIREGEYVGIIGPNGGGKTTFLKLLLGLLPAQSGEIRIFGTPLESFRSKYLVGYVPQRIAQEHFSFPLTVEEVVVSGRTPRRRWFSKWTKTDQAAVESALEISDLANLRKAEFRRLSGGQRQRVFIARALAQEAKILILDEPLTGVDEPSQRRFYEFLQKLHREFQITILFVTHDLDVIAEEVESVLCLNRELICHHSATELLKSSDLEKLYGRHVKFHQH